MKNVIEDNDYAKLAKLSLNQLTAFLILVFVIVVANVVLIYLIYIPNLLEPIDHLQPTTLASLESGFGKIIINLSVWLFVLFLVNMSLIRHVRNAKCLLRKMNEKYSGTE